MATTINDIAKKVGVSASTVSRVITGKAVISEETKNKILVAMKEMNYHPNSLARSFATGSSQAIALIVDATDDNENFSNYFFNRSVFGIEQICQDNGYNLIISNDATTQDGKSPIEKLILERKVDGLILPSSSVSTKLIKALNQSSFPFVVLGEPSLCQNESSWVDVNNMQGGFKAVRHFVESGYSSIGIIGGNDSQVFFSNRLRGYKEGLEKHGLKPNERWILYSDGTADSSYDLVSSLLQEEPFPDAFVCNNNIVAFGAMKAIKDKGLSIPENIGIISFDNFPLAEYMDPPLTVVDIDTYSLGKQAASILFQKIQKHVGDLQILIATNLIERKSTQRTI
ncbi:MAG: LacI family DNA-binding transcriptional regulator [Sphaerochaeta sp.]|nr:LacI family DNA-binding transcriptional regulator [Sphaerochaeta sp.]